MYANSFNHGKEYANSFNHGKEYANSFNHGNHGKEYKVDQGHKIVTYSTGYTYS